MSDAPLPSFFIDYPNDISAFAVGDLVCWMGQWRKVLQIGAYQHAPNAAYVLHFEDSQLNSVYPNYLPLPRIAAPILDALKQRDPYR